MKTWRILMGVIILMVVTSNVLAEQPEGATSRETVALAVSTAPTVTPAPVVPLTGTEMRLLPANYDVWACDWAPSGKAMAFAGKMQGELATKMRIWLWQLGPTVDPAPFTNTENLTDFAPRWSPDGKQLVMLRVTYGRTSPISGLWLKEVASGNGRQLTSSNQDRDPFWSPDGTRIVFVRGNGPYQSQLMTVNLADGSTAVLYGGPREVLYSPWWGVNGKIYFAKLSPYQKDVALNDQIYQVVEFGKGSIWVFDPQTRTLEAVVEDDYDNRLPALSPDGARLAYVSDRSATKDGNGKFDRGSLYIKNLVTGETRFVTNKVGLNGGSLSWSPDGKKLAFFTFRSIRPAVWVINLEPSTPVDGGLTSGPAPATPTRSK